MLLFTDSKYLRINMIDNRAYLMSQIATMERFIKDCVVSRIMGELLADQFC
jgi:hypothetical protein